MAEIGVCIASKISEYLVEPVFITPLRPIFCFKTIVKDFRENKTRLSQIRDKMNIKVERARNDARLVFINVQEWLAEVERVMPNVRCMENELEENTNCFRYGWCPNWTCHYRLSKQVLEMSATIRKLCEDGDLTGSVSHSAPLHQQIIGSPSSADFVHSRSSRSAFSRIMEALEEDGVNVIGLYGSTGTGKTKLAEQVASKAKELKIIDRVVMVTISQNPQVRSIQGLIADFLDLTLKQESEQGRASMLQLRMQKKDERILIIFDDVRKEFDMARVGIIPSNGWKILLTACSSCQVPVCIKTQRDVELASMTEHEAWALFQSIVGVGDEVRMLESAKAVITECRGLPKALVILGTALRGISCSDWVEALQQLKGAKLQFLKDVQEAAGKLRLKRDEINKEIKVAKHNVQVIKEEVGKWLTDVERVIEETDKFMNELNQNIIAFDDNDGIAKKKAEGLTTTVNKLCEDGRFDQLAHPAPILQNTNLSFANDFIPSKSADFACSEIMGALVKDDVNMIGLYGMGGIGKTTLAKQVQKEVLSREIFDRAIMVTISQRPEVRNIQGTIADFLNICLTQETIQGRARKLCQRLEDEKILIILDDIWKQLDLENIGISPSECKGCKILLTTRHRDVCTLMGCQASIQMSLLSGEEAQDLLMKKAGLSNESKLNYLVNKIVEECKYLPVALVTVGAALKDKGEDEWIEALDKLSNSRLGDIVGVNSDEKNAYKCLRWSYDYLKESSQGKQAQSVLMLCSLFPEDWQIEIEELTRCVFGMELFERVKSVEDVRRKVRVIISFLKDSCLLLDTGDKKTVRMHDVVRDVVLWIEGPESQEGNVLIVRDSTDLEDLIRRKSFQSCTAVSFMANVIPDLFHHELVCPNLEIMLIYGWDVHRFDAGLADGFFKHMKALKVLDLIDETWSHRDFPIPKSLQNLTNLRTLILRDCNCTNSSVLGELKNLEILALPDSDLDCGIVALTGLERLRLLDLSGVRGEFMFESQVLEKLIRLEELYDFHFEEDTSSGSNLSRSSLPPKLQVLSATFDSVRSVSSDFSFPNLQRYDVGVGRQTREINRRRDRSLKLKGVEEESSLLSMVNKLLPTVQDLSLKGCGDLYSLRSFYSRPEGFLQKLEILKVAECYKMECVFDFGPDDNNSSVQLQGLNMLTVKRLPELKQLWKEPTRFVSLRNLTHLEVAYCPKLRRIFSSPSLASSLRLKMLEIRFCAALEEVVSSAGTSWFQNLRGLTVEGCPKLKTIFSTNAPTCHCRLPQLQEICLWDNKELEHIIGHDQTHASVECPSLQELKVAGCPKLSSHFVATQLQAPSPKQFEDIRLAHIPSVQEIMQLERQEHDDEEQVLSFELKILDLWKLSDLKRIWSGPTHNISFLFLFHVRVVGCNQLKHLFTATTAATLSNLRQLYVEGCQALEQVIDDNTDETEGNHHNNVQSVQRLVFPKLAHLHLIDLPSLFSFCPTSCNLEFPCLNFNNLVVEMCTEAISEFFSKQSYQHKDARGRYRVVCSSSDEDSLQDKEVKDCPDDYYHDEDEDDDHKNERSTRRWFRPYM